MNILNTTTLMLKMMNLTFLLQFSKKDKGEEREKGKLD